MRQIEHLPSLDVWERAGWRRYLIDSVLAVVSTLLLTGIIYALHLYPSIPNISLTYLLIVLALASTRSMFSAVVSALVAFSSFDYFLVPPLYTFTIARIEEWLALFVFLTTAIITGQLASALRSRAEQASRQARETRILYELVRATNSEESQERQLHVIARAIVDVFASWGVRDCAILLPDANGKLVLQAGTRSVNEPVTLSADEAATAAWVMAQAQTVELHDVALAPQIVKSSSPRAIVRSTATHQTTRRYLRMIPIRMGQKVVGVVRLLIEDDPRLFTSGNSLGVEYVPKPFGMDEVLARIRVALRHAAQVQAGTEPTFTAGPLKVDFAQRLVQVNAQEVKLTPTEYDLLKALIVNRGKIMTRHMLLSQVWGTGYGTESHYLHVYVGQLRRKIEPDPAHPRFILTISGVGYRFSSEE